jgi:hypothetical protein
MRPVSLAKGTERIPAFIAVQAESSVAELCYLLPGDPVACENARQQKVKDRCPAVYATGRDAEDRDNRFQGSGIPGFP